MWTIQAFTGRGGLIFIWSITVSRLTSAIPTSLFAPNLGADISGQQLRAHHCGGNLRAA